MMMTVRKSSFMLMTMITALMRKRTIPVRWSLNWRMMRMMNLSQSLPLEDREDHVLNKDGGLAPQVVETNLIIGVVA